MVKLKMDRNNTLMDDSLKPIRIKESPMKSEDSLLAEDCLEKGFLRLYEYMGGILYILGDDVEMNGLNNVTLVAELTVTINNKKKEVKLGKVFNEFGYDYTHLMIRQLIHFADFYGYSLLLLDMTKRKRCA